MKRVLVAQVVDANNNNAQVLNARAMLARFNNVDAEWFALNYGEPDPLVRKSGRVHLTRLWRRHFWYFHKALFYQKNADAIFYPGPYWFDELGLWLRAITGRRVPLIATLEGLVGDEAREQKLSAWAGHPVFCQRVSGSQLARIDRIFRMADRIIAISPILADMGVRLYGNKVTVVPLGCDPASFHRVADRDTARFRIIGAGRIYENKRPELFLSLAAQFPQAEFVWFGEGAERTALIEAKARRGLGNVDFPGAVSHEVLLREMSRSDLLVLPSRSEGVPKVTMEAAAAGLPVIVFGFYRTPSVVDGVNGFVVWDDDELVSRVGQLIGNPSEAVAFGQCGVEMAANWSWDLVAPKWEAAILVALETT